VTLAKTLQVAGYQVAFMGIPDCESIVSPYGATYHTVLESIYPRGYSYENDLEPKNQRWKPHHLFPITRGALDSVLTGTNAPDLLISGYFTSLETQLIAYKYSLPYALITTYLRHPHDDPAMFAKTKLLYMPEAVSRKLMDAVLPTASQGMSIKDFVAPLGAASEMIPCPKQFDFTDMDWVHRAQVHYVEPMIERSMLSAGGTYTPETTITVPANKKLLFATSGSQVRDYEFKARQFFKSLIGMMQTQGMDAYYLVIAAGSWLSAELNREYNVGGTGAPTLPSNVTIVDWVSQLDILPDAEAVFMHGGLATIKESIWEEVPIIIVPHGKDQIDNALRIRRAGLGVVSEVQDLTPTDLRQLLAQATASPWIRGNLAKMRALMLAEENKPLRASLELVSDIVAP
jgi:UDP:flavonoid glycosyltransferase YjiC (YdhE family)